MKLKIHTLKSSISHNGFPPNGAADMPGEMGLLLGFSASPGHPCKQPNKTNWIEINKLNRKIENKKERDKEND